MKVSDIRFITLLLLFLSCWLYVYSDALLAMEAIWRKSETFAHGYFILPISLWLVWRDKEYLLASHVRISGLPLTLIFAALIVWLFAFAADVNVLGQWAAVLTLIGILWLLLGNELAGRYKFPLAYLLLAIPMGENLIPILQDVTAWFTVNLLNFFGIPVYRDGLYIQIPTGIFEVAVACSGIRYLIASIAVGTLFAHLTYTSLKKQLLFILFSAVLPIIANGIRAFGIVLIAHYSQMKYATGADHLVYGWVFFGFVILFMFYVGSKFADPEVTTQQKSANKASLNSVKLSSPLLLLVMLFSTQLLINNITFTVIPDQPYPAISEDENFQSVARSNWGITYNNGLRRSHLIDAKGLEHFRAVFANKQTQGELIGWENKEYNPQRWTAISIKNITIKAHSAKYLLLRDSRGTERVLIYWYKVANYYLTNKALVKFLQAIFVYNKPDLKVEIVAFSMVNGSEYDMVKQLSAFNWQSPGSVVYE
ncbi:exosortase A [Thalassotalea sp. 42_200_T64]|nr:exosortase A [Thalassotalea sp. 42_200_T64]